MLRDKRRQVWIWITFRCLFCKSNARDADGGHSLFAVNQLKRLAGWGWLAGWLARERAACLAARRDSNETGGLVGDHYHYHSRNCLH